MGDPKVSWAELAKQAGIGATMLEGFKLAKEVFQNVIEAQRVVSVMTERQEQLSKELDTAQAAIEKAKKDAEDITIPIMEDARRKATAIIRDAEQKASVITADARRELEVLQANINKAQVAADKAKADKEQAEKNLTEARREHKAELDKMAKERASAEAELAKTTKNLEQATEKLKKLKASIAVD